MIKNLFKKGETSALSDSPITWTADAEERLKKAPVFLRGMVRRLSEKKAQELGISVITEAVLVQFKEKMMTPMMQSGAGVSHDTAGVATVSLAWTREAEERLTTVPEFMRGMIRRIAEEVAMERGHLEVDLALLMKAEALGEESSTPHAELPWTDAARLRLEQKISNSPEIAREFVSGMLKNDAEDLARERGFARIDLAVLAQIWDAPKDEVVWTEEARKRLMTSPDFVRSGIKKAAERRARKMGTSIITSEMLTTFRNEAMMKAMKRIRAFGYREMSFNAFEDAKEKIRRLKDNPEAAKRLDDIRSYMDKRGKVGLIDEEMLEKMRDYLKDPSKKEM